MRKLRNQALLDPAFMSELEQSEATFRKPVYSLDFAPFSPFEESIADRPDLCFIFGYFCLMYCEQVVSGEKTAKMYRIVAGDASIRKFMNDSAFRYRIRDWADFVEKCKTNKVFDFLRRVTNISEEMFELVKENYSVRLPIAIDSVKYVKEVGQPTSLSALTDMRVFINKRKGRHKKHKENPDEDNRLR